MRSDPVLSAVGEPGVLNFTIELKKIREFREKFPVWKDADMFSLE